MIKKILYIIIALIVILWYSFAVYLQLHNDRYGKPTGSYTGWELKFRK
jgi:hypothetical protein